MQNAFIIYDFGESLAFKEMGEWKRWVPFHDRLDDITIPNNIKMLKFFIDNNMIVTFGRIACLREDGDIDIEFKSQKAGIICFFM